MSPASWGRVRSEDGGCGIPRSRFPSWSMNRFSACAICARTSRGSGRIGPPMHVPAGLERRTGILSHRGYWRVEAGACDPSFFSRKGVCRAGYRLHPRFPVHRAQRRRIQSGGQGSPSHTSFSPYRALGSPPGAFCFALRQLSGRRPILAGLGRVPRRKKKPPRGGPSRKGNRSANGSHRRHSQASWPMMAKPGRCPAQAQ